MAHIPAQIEAIRKNYPQNIMAATIDLDTYSRLDPISQQEVNKIIRSGLDNPASQVGAYVMDPRDYEKHAWLLDPIVQTYHHVSPNVKHTSDWDIGAKTYNLSEIDPSLKDVSIRIRVARNDKTHLLPGAMTRQDRITFERKMITIFRHMIDDPKMGGNYVSLTPGSEFHIDDDEYYGWVAQYKMFKDIRADPYLRSASIGRDWPYGRGMYHSQNGQLLVWVGEEDHLRMISMARGSDLALVFKDLRALLDKIERSALTFAVSEKYAAVTSCPSNVGTAMRASVHIPLPNLLNNEATMKKIAKSHGLSTRGVGGEHTAYGDDGMVDISPSARLGSTEVQTLESLYKGIAAMIEAENLVKV